MVSYEAIEEACCLNADGALDEIALQGLQYAEWEVEVLRYQDLPAIKERLDLDEPVVLILAQGQLGGITLGHAVVACELTDQRLTVMDPQVGDYVQLALADLDLFNTEILRGFVIAGAPAQNAR
jgi:hypothetical protein